MSPYLLICFSALMRLAVSVATPTMMSTLVPALRRRFGTVPPKHHPPWQVTHACAGTSNASGGTSSQGRTSKAAEGGDACDGLCHCGRRGQDAEEDAAENGHVGEPLGDVLCRAPAWPLPRDRHLLHAKVALLSPHVPARCAGCSFWRQAPLVCRAGKRRPCSRKSTAGEGE